jgi:hypothetical protein
MPRPSFRPTPEQRKLVKTVAALGLRQEHICVLAGIRSPKTLRKHFRQELFHGFAEAYAAVARTAYEMAYSGHYPAMSFFWDKCRSICVPEAEMQPQERPRKRKRDRGGITVITRPAQNAIEEAELDEAA